MDMVIQPPPITVDCLLCGWSMGVPSAEAAGTAQEAHGPRCPGRAEALADAMKAAWLKGVPFRPGGEIDWLRYARAVQSGIG